MRLDKQSFLIFLLVAAISSISFLYLYVEQGSCGSPAVGQWPVKESQSGGLYTEGRMTEVEYEDGTKETRMVFLLMDPGIGYSDELSSDFGPRTCKEGSKMHAGIDIPAQDGTRVFATVGGTVRKKGWCSGGGYRIVIEDDKGWFHSYMHLIDDESNSEYDPLVEEGMIVKAGQQIGWSDSTVNEAGKTCAAHLHYDVYEIQGGEPFYINPLSVLSYQNEKAPEIVIENPKDGAKVGQKEEDKVVEIKINVKTTEKDLSKVELFIGGDKKPAPESYFDFEGTTADRNKVKIKGVHDISKTKSYVIAGNVNPSSGSDDTFIYRWNTKVFLDSRGVPCAKGVTIKAVAHQAQGDKSEVASQDVKWRGAS